MEVTKNVLGKRKHRSTRTSKTAHGHEPTLKRLTPDIQTKHSDTTTVRQKRRGLPRPKTLPSYATKPIPGIPSTQAITSTEYQTPTRISNIIQLLQLFIRRNINQHRTQPFWKHVSLLRRNLCRLLNLHLQMIQLTTTQPRSNAESIRQLFEEEAKLRSQREVFEFHVREHQIPSAYVAFSCLIEDSQFANLGVVLMGILADAGSLVGLMQRIDKMPPRKHRRTFNTTTNSMNESTTVPSSITGTSTKITGFDQGEVIERIYDSSGGGNELEKTFSDANNDLGMIVARDEEPVKRCASRDYFDDEEGLVQESIIQRIDAPSHSEIVGPGSCALPAYNPTTAAIRPQFSSSSEDRTVSKPKRFTKQASAPKLTSPNDGVILEMDDERKSSPSNLTGEKVKKKKKTNAIDDLFGGLF